MLEGWPLSLSSVWWLELLSLHLSLYSRSRAIIIFQKRRSQCGPSSLVVADEDTPT